MDVEGAEYEILPRLLQERARESARESARSSLSLIDELFVEIHTEINTCCRPPYNKGRSYRDAKVLVRRLRDAGLYTHIWG